MGPLAAVESNLLMYRWGNCSPQCRQDSNPGSCGGGNLRQKLPQPGGPFQACLSSPRRLPHQPVCQRLLHRGAGLPQRASFWPPTEYPHLPGSKLRQVPHWARPRNRSWSPRPHSRARPEGSGARPESRTLGERNKAQIQAWGPWPAAQLCSSPAVGPWLRVIPLLSYSIHICEAGAGMLSSRGSMS